VSGVTKQILEGVTVARKESFKRLDTLRDLADYKTKANGAPFDRG